MEKLSIREASERFGLSRARLYQLLDKGAITGHRSAMRGRSAKSWVDAISLQSHIENRHENLRHGKGGPKILADGAYIPVCEAVKKSGYSRTHLD